MRVLSTRRPRLAAAASLLAFAASALALSHSPAVATPAVTPASNPLVIGDGFDTCQAPSSPQMDTFRSQNSFVGIYIYGVSKGCSQDQLGPGGPSWIQHQLANGWHFIPYDVDLQAPCTNFAHRFSYNSSTAFAQGKTSADGAVQEGSRLGFGPSGTIYYDLEGFPSAANDQACLDAARAFISGYTAEMHAKGYNSGMYGSAQSSYIDYMAGASNIPDYIQYGESGGANTNSSYISNGHWIYHQRVKQYNLMVPDSRAPSGSVDWDCANSYLDGTTASSFSC